MAFNKTNKTDTANAANSKKKFSQRIALCTVALAGGLALMVAGINAYLTESDTVVNTFTVGEVTVDTLEPNFPGNGSDEVSDIVPLQEVAKDPQIRNTGKNRAIAFIQVDIPMANIVVADEEGWRVPEANTEVFDFRTTDGTYDSFHDEKWIELSTIYLDKDNQETDDDISVKVRRLYGYKTVLEENETTLPIFDVVRLCNVVEGLLDDSIQNIVITTYAIQADNIAGITNENWNETMDADTLVAVFKAYMNQSGDVISEDADNGNYQTIIDTTLNLTMTVQNRHLKMNSGDPTEMETVALYNVAYTGPNEKPVPVFASEDENVVTIDQDGNIKAVGVGKTKVTMTAINPDTNKELTVSVTISVRDMNPGEQDTSGSGVGTPDMSENSGDETESKNSFIDSVLSKFRNN